MHHAPSSDHGWTSQCAACLVSSTCLSASAIVGLEKRFIAAGCSEVWVVLANDKINLDVYMLVHQGAAVHERLHSHVALPESRESAAGLAMRAQNDVVHLTAGSPDCANCGDWELMEQFGVQWMMAAAICCRQNLACNRLMGAVLVGGRSPTPSLDPSWLDAWSTELGQAIAHASISVMEHSLEMLRSIFPSATVEALIASAINAQAEVPTDLYTVSGTLLSARDSDDLFTVDNQSQGSKPARTSNDSNSTDKSLTHHSPFALVAKYAPRLSAGSQDPGSPAVLTSPKASLTSLGSGPTASAVPQGTAVNRLMSAPSMGTSAHHLAAGVLRQASLASDPSYLFTDAPGSPAASELLGFEDILEEDAAIHRDNIMNDSEWCPASPPLSPRSKQHQHRNMRSSTTTVLEEGSEEQEEYRERDYNQSQSLSPIQEGSSNLSYGESTAATLDISSGKLSSKLSTTMERIQPHGVVNKPWGLTFLSYDAENRFSAWYARNMRKHDVRSGLGLAVVIAVAVSVQPNLLLSMGPGLVAVFVALMLPGLLALGFKSWWISHRCVVIPALRLLAVVTLAVFQTPGDGGQWLVHVLWLAIHSVQYPLLLSVHVPLQLLCLWALASAFDLNVNAGSVPHAWLLQLGLGLVAPTSALWLIETWKRKKFVRNETSPARETS